MHMFARIFWCFAIAIAEDIVELKYFQNSLPLQKFVLSVSSTEAILAVAGI